MIHNLPSTPAFINAKVDDPIQELALRVVVELPGWEMHVIGTATLIAGNLAITAKHVLDAIVNTFGARAGAKSIEVEGYSIRLYQVFPGPIYRIWDVRSAWTCPSDIAILHLNLYKASTEKPVQWRSPRLRLLPPPPGSKVLAFGYRESKIHVTEDAEGTHHIVLDDVPTTASGEVGAIFPERRDLVMLPFPCFEVYARFAPGMSGGLIIDENGALCGLVCAGLEMSDPDAVPLSYAATLWPMLRTVISADRGGKYLRGIDYPVIDLALDGLIHAIGLEELDPAFFPGRMLPTRPKT